MCTNCDLGQTVLHTSSRTQTNSVCGDDNAVPVTNEIGASFQQLHNP